MPVRPDPTPSRGITLPPRGWFLTLLLALYILPGLTGHDPWKADDAITIGVVYDILTYGNWLMPELAGRPYPDAPLYYWLAALTAKIFSWGLPIHEGARLASGLCTLLALSFILFAARELHGRENAASGPLILAGSIGFLYHAHEAQPMLAALSAHTAAYWGLTLLSRRPQAGGLIFGVALGATFLANGLLPALMLFPVSAIALWCARDRRQIARALLTALAPAMLLALLWLLPLHGASVAYFDTFWHNELDSLRLVAHSVANTLRYLNLLAWYAWPALPLAAWTLWAKRRTLSDMPVLFPLLSFFFILLALGLSTNVRSAPALLLLPPLVLLAVPGVAMLRRGAANAFDWFAMITFSVFAGLVWIGWCAMVFGWPPRLAKQVLRLTPGFTAEFGIVAFLIALGTTLAWAWLITTSPRGPMRSITHWMAGLVLFWLLVVALWIPWINYGKTYRPIADGVARTLPARAGCIAASGVPESVLASLDYFSGIRTTPLASDAGKSCDWVLLQGSTRNPESGPGTGWRKEWEGRRPSDRHERFRLYRRDNSSAPSPVE